MTQVNFSSGEREKKSARLASDKAPPQNRQAAPVSPSATPAPAPGTSLDLGACFESVSQPLAQLEEALANAARMFDPGVAGYVQYTCTTGGKRLRSGLIFLAAQATGQIQPSHLILAQIVELIHLATLVHDDILDGALLRRAHPTAFAKWGAEISVLLGDCLFCQALVRATELPDSAMSRQLAQAANEVCMGEILQTQRQFDLNLTTPEYLRIIGLKTASLFRVGMELAGALNGAAPAAVAALRACGEQIGTAYQLYDDCLDLLQSESTTGKTAGTDLEKGKLTLPLLHALQQVKEEEKAEISHTLLHGNTAERQALLGWATQRGGLKQGVRKIQSYLTDAQTHLTELPNSWARTSLEGFLKTFADQTALLATG